MERMRSKVDGAPPPPLSGAVPPPVKVSHHIRAQGTVPKLPQSAFVLVSSNTNVISLFASSIAYIAWAVQLVGTSIDEVKYVSI